MSRTVPLVPFLLLAAIASAENLRIPSAEGPLTINGVPDEELWKHAIVLPLRQADFGSAFPSAGEMRAVIRGDYLCLSAQVPETGRVVARSTGSNPAWWNEDLLTWSLHFRS